MDQTGARLNINTEQVRVRFLSNLGRDYYVQIAEFVTEDTHRQHDGSQNKSTDPEHLQSQLQRNMEREREIFLKASLQLLDLQDANYTTQQRYVHSNHNGVNPQSLKRDTSSGTQTHRAGHPTTNHHDENNRYDVIRLGLLRKGRHGAFSPGNNPTLNWKRKYVELRHGVFTYDDFNAVGSINIEDLTTCDQSNIATRRSIPLSIDHTICRVYESYQDDRVFEIVVDNGPRRIWMANSASECQEWIRAIHSAMLGISSNKSVNAANVLVSVLGNGVDTSFSFQSHHSDNYSGGNGATNNSKHGEDSKDSSSKQKDSIIHQDHGHGHNWLSIDGAAAPYAHDMSYFLSLQQEFNQSSEEGYRNLLRTMLLEKAEITIPVLFIKSKTTHANFILSPQDSLNTQNVHAKCTSQVWKDLQRDIIVVNGDLISGELGAEAMVGALVRHISDKVVELKSQQEPSSNRKNYKFERHEEEPSNAIPQFSRISLFSPSSQKPITHVPLDENELKTTPFSIPFTVTEAQIVQCARDLLVLCNRTQSGGDTYFCVDALLSGDKSRGISILTPYSPEAEPLHFKVDVVHINSFQNLNCSSGSPSRKRGTVTDQKIVNAWHGKIPSTSNLSDMESHPGRSLLGTIESNSPQRHNKLNGSHELHRTPHDHGRSHNSSRVDMSSDTGSNHHIGHHGKEHAKSEKTNGKPGTTHSTTTKRIKPTSPIPSVSSSTKRQNTGGSIVSSSDSNGSHVDLSLYDGQLKPTIHHQWEQQQFQLQSTPAAHRKPQLDLISELEKDGFFMASGGGSRGGIPSPVETRSDHTVANRNDLETSSNQFNNHHETQTVPLFPAIQSPSHSVNVSSNLPSSSTVSTTHNSTNHSLIPEQLVLKDEGKDDSSIISELTWDTYYQRNQISKISSTIQSQSKQSNSEGLLGIGDRYNNQHSGLDDVIETANEEDSNVGGDDDCSTDPSLKAGKPKKKSILKKLGKTLKPFKIAEGFEGLTSPFKQSKGSHRSGVDDGKDRNVQSVATHDCTHNDTEPHAHEYVGNGTAVSSKHTDVFKCIRIQVEANCKYKVCSANPTGNEETDSWAVITGTFYQSFYIVGDGSCLLGIADRLVTISVDDAK